MKLVTNKIVQTLNKIFNSFTDDFIALIKHFSSGVICVLSHSMKVRKQILSFTVLISETICIVI